MKVNATTTVVRIQLAILGTLRPAAPGNAGFLDAPKNRIEFVVANVKRIMMRRKGLGGVKVQGQLIVNPHRGKVSHRPIVVEAENLREEFRRRLFVLRRHYRVIQFNCHNSSLICLRWGPLMTTPEKS